MSIRKIVHEGEQLSHSEILNESESIAWEMIVEENYDIAFSIRAHTISSSLKSAWTVVEARRTSKLKGEITSADLKDDGIQLPVMIEFCFDNGYSWFNPKQVVLTLDKTRRLSPRARENVTPSPPEVPRELSRTSSVSTPDSVEQRHAETTRTKMDMLWMQQVLTEAVERCPASMPQLRIKLTEARDIVIGNKYGNRSPPELEASI